MSIKQSKHDLAMTVLAERWNVEDLKKQNAELLAALEEITGAYERLLQAYGKPFEWGTVESERLRELIAKAKGE